MNKIHIIGNLTADPELRTTTTGSEVCTFTVAVNRRKTQNNQNPVADFFRVSAWNEKGKVCQKYLTKGKKVSVVGSVSIHVYSANDGSPRGSLEVFAEDVEFLTPKGNDGYIPVDDQDNPFVGG
jgi:single-strand DNA-binding protein